MSRPARGVRLAWARLEIVMVGAVGLALKDHGRTRTVNGRRGDALLAVPLPVGG